MGDSQIPPELQSSSVEPSNSREGGPPLFSLPPPEPSNRGKVIGVTAVIALATMFAGVLLLRGGKTGASKPQNAVLPADSYARNLVFSQLAMSESTSLSGGKSTFIDGHVRNTGPDTVTGVTLQVLFRNDVGFSPQVETVPLTLIRTHEPYVDTEPVNAAPLKPGGNGEFRVIFETVNANWNQQMPEIVVIRVSKH